MVEITANSPLSSAALVKEGDKCLLTACSLIILDLFTTAGEELDGGICLDLITFRYISVRGRSGVEVGHDALHGGVNDARLGVNARHTLLSGWKSLATNKTLRHGETRNKHQLTLLIDRLQVLAVSAPRRGECDENVFRFILPILNTRAGQQH